MAMFRLIYITLLFVGVHLQVHVDHPRTRERRLPRRNGYSGNALQQSGAAGDNDQPQGGFCDCLQAIS